MIFISAGITPSQVNVKATLVATVDVVPYSRLNDTQDNQFQCSDGAEFWVKDED